MPWSAFLQISKVNTDECGQPIADQFIKYDAILREILSDEDWGTYASGLPEAISISKAWNQHVTNKSNQLAGAKIIGIFQRVNSKNECGNLLAGDIKAAVRETIAIAEQFVQQFVSSCANC